MNDLRVSLIVIGVLVIAGVYLLGWLNQRRRRSAIARRYEPELSAPAADKTAGPDASEFQMRLDPHDDDGDALVFRDAAEPAPIIPAFAIKKTPPETRKTPPEPRVPAKIQPRPVAVRPDVESTSNTPAPERVVVLNVVAREERPFRGDAVRKTLETLGLEFGKLGLFHYFDSDSAGARKPVFNVASMIKPGTFDRATLSTYTTPGLTLFMQIPGPLAASEAFEAMNQCAGSIAVRLGGTVCDEQRIPVTPQRARELRETLLAGDFSRAVQTTDGFGAGERH